MVPASLIKAGTDVRKLPRMARRSKRICRGLGVRPVVPPFEGRLVICALREAYGFLCEALSFETTRKHLCRAVIAIPNGTRSWRSQWTRNWFKWIRTRRSSSALARKEQGSAAWPDWSSLSTSIGLSSVRSPPKNAAGSRFCFGGFTWKHEDLIRAVFQGCGYSCEKLPVPNVAAFQMGKEYGNNG